MFQLLRGDCLELMRDIQDKSVDLVVTSPPYDNLREYNGFVFKFKETAQELFRIVKNGAVIVWVVGDATISGSETGTSFRQALYFKEIGFNLHDTMIYAKKNPIPLSHKRYEQQFEYMFVLSKNKINTFNAIREKCKNGGKIEKYGEGRRRHLSKKQSIRNRKTEYRETKTTKLHTNIFYYGVGFDNRLGHPAPFPLKLAEDQVASWSNKGDIVLDCFMGSGTTGVACHNLDRQFIGIEKDPEYFNIAAKRIKDAQKQLKLF